MSTIYFECKNETKEALAKKVFEIIKDHYFETVEPPVGTSREAENDETYITRLTQLMNDMLYKTSDSDEGIVVEFDTTEDAGFAIAENVYKTSNGYRVTIHSLKTIIDIEKNDTWKIKENLDFTYGLFYRYRGVLSI